MANAVKGQKSFEVDGQTYLIEFTPNGFCELEDKTGKATMAFLVDLGEAAEGAALRFRDVRLLFWAGLQEHHPDLSEREAGRLMRALGGLVDAMSVIQDAIALSMPDSGEGAEGEGENPPTATA